MSKVYKYIFLLATTLAVLSSCVQEIERPLPGSDLPYPEGGKAVIEVSALFPGEIRTKAMADAPQGITSMRVAVFGSSGFLKEVQDVDLNDGYFQSATANGALYRFRVKLTLTDSKRLRVHVIANMPSEITFPWKGEDEVMRRYAYTEGTQDAYWCRFVLTNGLELKKEYVDSTDSFEYVKDGDYYMVTDEVTTAFTNLPLLRNFAKVSVESTTPQLILNPTTTMAIINKPRYGSIAPCLSTGGFVENYYQRQYSWLRANYDGFSPIDTALVNKNPDEPGIFVSSTVSGNVINGGDFMYERPRETATPTYMIIHGKYRKLQDGKLLSDWKSTNLPEAQRYPNNADDWLVPEGEAIDGYYKIDFMDTSGYYAIFRNFRYHIRITGVSKAGAETPGAAGSTGGTGDISSSTEAQGLTDISDGYGRIAVSYVEMTLVNQHPVIELKYKFIPDVDEGDVPDNRLVSEDGPVTIEIQERSGPVNVFASTFDSGVASGTEIGDASKGKIRVLSGTDAEGYRTIQFTTNAPSSIDRASQVVRIVGRIDQHRTISRDVKYYLMEKQDMTVTCEADEPAMGYELNEVERVAGAGVNVKIKIPILLPESMFPLIFHIESDQLSITPNTAKYTTENLPVESGESICTGKEGVRTFHYVRTLSYSEYNSLVDNNGKTFVCHFKTNKDISASAVYVTNEYFNKGSSSFTNYHLFNFKNMQFSNYRAAANDQTLTFTFSRDDEDNSGARVVKVTLDGLTVRGNGWSEISADDGEYSWTIPSGSSSATLNLRTTATDYSIMLEAFDGSTGKAIYHPADIYNMDYLEADLQINNTNYNQNSITEAGVSFAFTNVTGGGNNNNRYKTFGSGTYYSTTPGSVLITAPSNYMITAIEITYSGTYSSQTVTYDPAGTSSDKNSWYGRSNSVTVTMAGSRNNSNRVTRIKVTAEVNN
ncbi:MAG: hypothetical protein J5667_01125 [Bacteroidales bacterium]|nr:hypothetical protein [Bacteroidales bacterium]